MWRGDPLTRPTIYRGRDGTGGCPCCSTHGTWTGELKGLEWDSGPWAGWEEPQKLWAGAGQGYGYSQGHHISSKQSLF